MARKVPEGAAAEKAGRRTGPDKLLRTADVLKRTGITHQVLYRYVTLGLIEPAVTTPSGTRLFRPETVDLIELIKSFNESGYSLRDLKDTFFKDEKVRRLLASDR